MKADFDIRTSEEYPEGCFCECGCVIHLKYEELITPVTEVKCPICGHVVRLYIKGSDIDIDDNVELNCNTYRFRRNFGRF